ncbi:unnamed protein product [Blepharisma stoltei]|uniref:MORN repeat-containing protein n=1 Tax=Blepharisma stoltei TaxID=1481888 RepID=A0AAU9ISY0_9CILI|nr:unnamed protein product [Blepharisma stoltei]
MNCLKKKISEYRKENMIQNQEIESLKEEIARLNSIINANVEAAELSSSPKIALIEPAIALNPSEAAQTSMNYQELNEVPANILTTKVKEVYERVGPYEFDADQLVEVTWRGPRKLPDGSLYVGEWNDRGQPEGRGMMYCADGGICEGSWKTGKLHGKGRRINSVGDMYLGDWVEGKMNGSGRMEYSVDNHIYEGEWINGKQEGFGSDKWPDGSKFEGNYKDGARNGQGKFVWADGSHYEGGLVNSEIEGIGEYVWPNGNKYKGEWKSCKMHGKGKFAWPDGRHYEGDYADDKKEGYGIFVWTNG